MHFKNSDRFEEAVFGRCSGDRRYIGYKTFSEGMLDLIEQDTGPVYPDTRLGELLYFGVYEELKRVGVYPGGLKFKSAQRSRVDIHHFTDGYFYLPSFPKKPVTVDLFNLDSEIYEILRSRWENCDKESDFQTRLFQYKTGMAEFWKSGGSMTDHWDHIFAPPDFCSSEGGPKNHLILTPFYTENHWNREQFSKLVAGCLASPADTPNHENMALLSP